MANNKKNSKKNGNKKAKTQRKSIKMVVPRGPRLDKAAADYAALIANPCTGPLVPGPFGDGGSGLIVRTELDQVFDAQATANSSFIGFIPGTATVYYAGTTTLAGDATVFTPTATAASSPGATYLGANAASFRCLAACLQVYYPGSELTRAGITAVGQLPAANLVNSAVSSTAQIRTACQYVERVPAQMSEIIWRPSNYDLEWTEPGVGAEGASLTGKRSAIYSSTTGIPVSTGMRYRLIAVYEYLPLTNAGLVTPIVAQTSSNNTFQDVIHKLDSLGDWMYHGAMAVSNVASQIPGGGALSTVSYGVAKLAQVLKG